MPLSVVAGKKLRDLPVISRMFLIVFEPYAPSTTTLAYP